MNKQQLAAKIWDAANKMRSKIEANDYKDYILGFIFYRFLSEKQLQYLKDNGYEDDEIMALDEDDIDNMEYIRGNLGYFISYRNLYTTWVSGEVDFDVTDVRDALNAFERLLVDKYKRVYSGIFDTLQIGLSKLGENAGKQTKAIRDLLALIKDIPMDGKQDYDVLGFIYEDLIKNFASNAGKKAGEFYTPHEISVLMSEIIAHHLQDRDQIEIYDPTSGSGSLLINIGNCAAKYLGGKNCIKYYAQELKQNTYNLTRMNLVMRGIDPANIVTRNADTLEDDWPFFEEGQKESTYKALRLDAVVSNPPYSQAWDPSNKALDPRYNEYGLAPKGKADYAFLLHDLYHLKSDGIMTIVLPHGVLFRGGEEGNIRKNLIEHNKIDAIIGLPANIFYGTGIPTIVMVLKPTRTNSDVLIIDASKGFIKEGKNNKLRACDIKKIVDTVVNRSSIENFSRVVTRQEIRDNDYNLNIPRYVDSSEKAESWDIYATMFGGIPVSEVNQLSSFWNSFDGLYESLFNPLNSNYVELRDDDIKTVVNNNNDVFLFKETVASSFNAFKTSLHDVLINHCLSVELNKIQQTLGQDIFTIIENYPLIDKYEAYEIFDSHWKQISSDLEIIQSEGMESIRKVDPVYITKKVNNKDEEVQNGWNGRIIPYELVHQSLLKEINDQVIKTNDSLNDIASNYSEIIDNLSEENKELPILKEGGEAFDFKEVKTMLKQLKYETDNDSIELKETLQLVISLQEDEKSLRKLVKEKEAQLLSLSKTTIENLTDDQVNELLQEKWINPLINELSDLPNQVINRLITCITSLSHKYSNTLKNIEQQIHETEKQLAAMMDELTGNEFDMKGIKELQSLLLGDYHD